MIVHYKYEVDDNYGDVQTGNGQCDTDYLVSRLRPVLGSFIEEFRQQFYPMRAPFRYSHHSQIANIFVEIWENDAQRKAMDDQVSMFELQRQVNQALEHLARAIELIREINGES